MARKANHRLLDLAKINKRDEFTLYPDIERELQYYLPHFKDKTVYCNCDDPETSNFYRYFARNFHRLGLRKLNGKKFLIISSVNEITYKEVFMLIQSGKIWLGVNFGGGISGFI